MNLDEDSVIACVDLVGRTGATGFEFGYLHDDVPSDQAGWWAHAQYKGARISVADHKDPVGAIEALAKRLLKGAKCAHCGGLVALSDRGAFAFQDSHLVDGSEWTVEQAAAAGQCRWTRMGRRWEMGCQGLKARPPAVRKQPKKAKRRKRRNR